MLALRLRLPALVGYAPRVGLDQVLSEVIAAMRPSFTARLPSPTRRVYAPSPDLT